MSNTPIYFRLFIDDYLRDAEELSMLRHGAYFRLMLWYYGRAKPIPNDLVRIYQRVNARSGEEEGAVRAVLAEFFVLKDNVWTHKRIEAELAHWAERSSTARESVRQREKKRLQINDSFTSNDDLTMIERSSNQNQNQNQKVLDQTKSTDLSALAARTGTPTALAERKKATRLPAEWKIPEEWLEWAAKVHGIDRQRGVRISLVFRDFWVSKAGQNGGKMDWQATWRNWIRKEVGDA